MNERTDVAHLLREKEQERRMAYAARRQYLMEHERLERMSRDYFVVGRMFEGEGAHYFALMALNAAEVEISDPRPRS